MSTTAAPQPRPDWQSDWQQLLSYLPQDYEQLAREHKMLEVQYGNAKIKTAQDLLRFVFVHVGCDLPLRQSVAVVGAAGGPKLSAMRLHKKMQRAPSYLEALIARMVPVDQDARPEEWAGFEMLETAGYVVLFTTASRGAMPARRCLAAYRLRWQVELLFKRCKSLCGFDRLPNYRDDTIHAWLCAKVLLGLIMDRIGSAAAGVFPLHGGTENPSAPASAPAASHGAPTLEADEHPACGDDRRALALQAERPARCAAEHHAAA